MNIYNCNNKKNKKALKQIYKKNVKSAKGFVKFCYYSTIFFRLLAVILVIVSFIEFLNTKEIEIFIISVLARFFIPYLISFFPEQVCVVKLSGEYKYRIDQSITLNDDGFIYSYRDSRIIVSNNVIYKIKYNEINHYEYDEETKILKISGGIYLSLYEDGKMDNNMAPSEDISLLNVYDVDIYNLIKNNGNLGE